jgi:hypothetical protein
MLRLLLDQHISPDVIVAGRRREPGIQLEHVRQRLWHALSDPELLRAAHSEHLTLVTYDQATIPEFLRQFARDQEDHAGVIFVDNDTIRQSDIGGLARALTRLWSREKTALWLNRTLYLGRG